MPRAPPKEVPLAIPSPIGYAGLIAENARLIGERYFAVDTSPFTRYEDLWIINHSALKQFQNQESVNKLTALAKGDVEEDVRRISALMLGRIAWQKPELMTAETVKALTHTNQQYSDRAPASLANVDFTLNNLDAPILRVLAMRPDLRDVASKEYKKTIDSSMSSDKDKERAQIALGLIGDMGKRPRPETAQEAIKAFLETKDPQEIMRKFDQLSRNERALTKEICTHLLNNGPSEIKAGSSEASLMAEALIYDGTLNRNLTIKLGSYSSAGEGTESQRSRLKSIVTNNSLVLGLATGRFPEVHTYQTQNNGARARASDLYYAAMHFPDIQGNIKTLKENGYDINERDSSGRTALTRLFAEGEMPRQTIEQSSLKKYKEQHWMFANMLLWNGADPTIKDNTGKSAEDYLNATLNIVKPKREVVGTVHLAERAPSP